MKHRAALFVAVVGFMIAVAVLAGPKKSALLSHDWAMKDKMDPSPLAILVELGRKDGKETAWDGQATVEGAKVVHREGYRFRPKDSLVDPDSWKASSHKPSRVGAGQPAVLRTEGMASVGVVLHLADVKPDATLTVKATTEDARRPAVVKIKDLVGGKPELFWDDALSVRRISAATPLVTTKTEDDFPAAAYGPDGALWVAWVSYTLKDPARRIEQKPFQEEPKDFKQLNTPEFGDQVWVQYRHAGSWSKPVAVTGPKEDIVRCAISVAGDGTAWVAYTANRGGNCDVYARSLDRNTPEAVKNPTPKLGEEQRLTKSAGPDLGPVLCTDQNGTPWLAAQSWDDEGTARISVFRMKDGKWTDGPALPGVKPHENRWHPALAAAPDGKVALAYDVYRDGDYDVRLAMIDGDKVTEHDIATSPRFEVRPALTYDTSGRLWIAYEEGPEKWGKDYGAQDSTDGNPLYNSRSVRVVCLDAGKLLTPTAKLPTSANKPPSLPLGGQAGPNFERAKRYSSPALGLDDKGRLWLTYREKFGSRYSTQVGSYWLSFARRLDGDAWSEPVELSHSDGLLDYRPVVLPSSAGGALIIHNTDGRYTTPADIDNQVYASIVDLPGDPVEPKLAAHEPGKKDGKSAEAERKSVNAIRDYRIEAGGKKYQPLRGEFHRHTEISWDGGPDGSLEDMFRYSIDAVAFDWIGNGDHDSGGGREYTWWLIQKMSDAYQVGKVFTPMFTYERSVGYPHGHRNCMFAKRGVRTLPRLAEMDKDKRVAGIHENDTKMLYRYLHELDGICAVHTSATSMGTDWRDNDPKVEPIVEIYQGDRMSYEIEGAPRAGYEQNSGKTPVNIAGWYPKGFVNLALGKGYRLGFEASSDHWSTHISCCIVLAEKHDRASILEAIKKRHVYAATDNIIVDVKSGEHIQGDEWKTDKAPVFTLKIVGTGEIAQIDVLRDSEVVETIKPGKAVYEGEWKDPKPTAGSHYYYVRVLQKDDEIAWGSPLWVEYAP